MTKELVNWSVDTQVVRNFKQVCVKNGKKYSHVVTDLMTEYVKKTEVPE